MTSCAVEIAESLIQMVHKYGHTVCRPVFLRELRELTVCADDAKQQDRIKALEIALNYINKIESGVHVD